MNLQGLLNVGVEGLAYGMLLFLISIGLSITLGLMRFINLAHGAFAMCGGYLMVVLMNDAHLSFFSSLVAVFLATGAIGLVLERTLIKRLYGKSELQHVLFSIGLAFVASAIATILFGPQQQAIGLPGWMSSPVDFPGMRTTGYRLFILAAGVIALSLLYALFHKTLFGARVRAAVDSQDTASSIGIPVSRLFALTFGLGAAFAGLGGALAISLLGLDPSFPLKYLVIMLMVVAMGGSASILGAFSAALFLGTADALFKYYIPEVGSFVIYALLVLTLIFLPKGLAGRRS